ncbi:hypothetical protein A7P53_15050 [Acinetobacter defluvii]|uniref:hypothetical protein n=1 Tax=Acinetobacter defluvii TaxID=1871111 RepID=UPI00148F570A|nr:hypothetical protein [Acinetobacter defluvii]NNP73901.1 hypothetical protein [Acinetobacter defluvii]
MSNTQNTNKSDSQIKEKQIVFRVTEAQHREIRIKAATEGDFSANQFSKKYILENLCIETEDTESEQKQA